MRAPPGACTLQSPNWKEHHIPTRTISVAVEVNAVDSTPINVIDRAAEAAQKAGSEAAQVLLYRSEALDILRVALTGLSERGWKKGDLLDFGTGKVCALGAVSLAAKPNQSASVQYPVSLNLNGPMDEALFALARNRPAASVEEFDRPEATSVHVAQTQIYRANDSAATTEEIVHNWFGDAILDLRVKVGV